MNLFFDHSNVTINGKEKFEHFYLFIEKWIFKPWLS